MDRQRSLIPYGHGDRRALEGWVDDDVAIAAGQLFGRGDRAPLVVDGTQLLGDTARVVGASLGERHFRVWTALITFWASRSFPSDGWVAFTLGELAKLIWGEDRVAGRNAEDRDTLLEALFDLRAATVALPNFDAQTGQPTQDISDTGLLINLSVAHEILRSYVARDPAGRADAGRNLGGDDETAAERARGLGARRHDTIRVRLHPDYVERLAGADLRRFDWLKAHRLTGTGLMLWLVFSSPRVPYRALLESPEGHLVCEVPLNLEACRALGVHAAAKTDRRKTLRRGCAQVLEVDTSFVTMEVCNVRSGDDFLRIVRLPRDGMTERPALAETPQTQLAV